MNTLHNLVLHTSLCIALGLGLSQLSACNSETGAQSNPTPPQTTAPTVTDTKTDTAPKTDSATSDNTLPKASDVLVDNAALVRTFLSQYPKGVQSRRAPIVLSFRQPIVNAEQLDDAANVSLKLDPAVTGKLSFASQNSITFTPDQPLDVNKNYSLTLDPKGLLNIPADTPPLNFAFKTPPLELEVISQGLSPIPDKPNTMQLSGTVYTSDYAPADGLEKAVQALVQSKVLPMEWEHNSTNTEHRFSIKSIPRETFATDLTLRWEGKALGAQGENSSGERQFAVPSQKTFSITRIETKTDGDDSRPHIVVTFSDALDSTQDLSGLVQLDGVSVAAKKATASSSASDNIENLTASATEAATPEADESEDESDNAETETEATSAESDESKLRIQVIANQLLVYPQAELATGEHKLILNAGIKAATASLGKLTERTEQAITLEAPQPAIRFVGNGNILPDNQVLQIPIEARAVNAVQVTAFEIYPENIERFLQVNSLNGDSELERVGRYLWRKTIPLNAANTQQWNRYTLDVSQLLRTKPGTLYRLELAVDRRHAAYTCPPETVATEVQDAPLKNQDDQDTTSPSGWDGIAEYYADGENYDYNWEKRENPCDDAYYYYSDHVKAKQNFMASNVGLIAKQEADGKVHVIATDLRSAQPINQVQLTLHNYQGQTLATGQTDAQGFATLNTTGTPFLLLAKTEHDQAYLKLNANGALETSQFDVGGETVNKGLKGYVYGERGVWRPGDDIHLTFALQDRAHNLPANHPMTMQLFDPAGKLKQTVLNKNPVGPFYPVTLKTDDNDPTGDWLVKAVLGGTSFNKTLKIETIRPNRLKVELDYGVKALMGYEDLPPAKLFAQWLHGGTAADLKADVSVRLREKTTQFSRYADYNFDDPARHLDSEEQQLLEGRLDDKGYLTFNKSFQPEQPAPGALSAWFTSRVYENGGGFSISKQDMDYYPFQHYVGIKLPKGDAERGMLLTDKDHTVDIASVDAEGNPVALDKVQVTLYKVEWKWWFDKTSDSLAEYADSSHSGKLQQSIISTKDGQGTWSFQIKYPDWGRYLVRACDLEGEHCSGKTVYVDWPGWAGRAQQDGSGAASMLRFSSDKTAYQVGETAQIQLPEAHSGRALLTVENSSQILEQRWLELKGDRAQISIPMTAAMSPNVYVSVSLLQPHQNKKNDLPLRLYGIIPLEVTDPKTVLKPLLQAADEWRPETEQVITVTEQNGQAMDYTLAVVDEGLLGLTRYKSPDLHQAFYQKEALGIKTWDMFDQVIGAYSQNLERMLAIGGGDEAQVDDAAAKPKRFNPVVQYLGAFHLDAGQSRLHNVKLPPYLGAVRVMLVAANTASDSLAYGMSEKSVFVRQPLMMLSSLPRTLKVNETVSVPITLFVTDPNLKQVSLSADSSNGFVKVAAPQTLTINGAGEQVAFIEVQTDKMPQQGKLHLIAQSGNERSEETVNIDIQAPNLPSIRNVDSSIAAQAAWSGKVTPHGIAGTNSSTLTLSSLPNLHLEQQLNYLIHYPYGCLEQTVSTAFPQLYLPKLLKLAPEQQQQVEHHIKRALSKLNQFQATSGNLMYWPGSNEANDWASIYAGHFINEAQRQGYNVPLGLFTAWVSYQQRQAQEWTNANSNNRDASVLQAYRLYVLALAGKPSLGAMNRLREAKQLAPQARWLLAAAYQLAGQTAAAQDVSQGLVATQLDAPTPDFNFNHSLGNLGIQLETLLALNKPQDAELIVQKIAEQMGTNDPYNTHDTSWALVALGHYMQQANKPLLTQVSLDGAAPLSLSGGALYSQLLNKADQAFAVEIKNQGTNTVYANFAQRGIAAVSDERAEEHGLGLALSLWDSQGKEIWSPNKELANPPLQLAQGQDYTLQVVVKNTSQHDLKRLALNTLLPSGAEIARDNIDLEKAGLSYQDVRDDRVQSFFDLKANEEKVVKVRWNAAFLGEFYLPASNTEVMYQPDVYARSAGLPIKIVKTLAADANRAVEPPAPPVVPEKESEPKGALTVMNSVGD